MRKKSFEIAIVAMFVALIAVLQVSPLYIPTSWGMRIDLVAVPVLIAYFLFGLRTSLAVSVGMFVALSFVAAESLIGASAKWIATTPMIITPALMSLRLQRKEWRKDIGIVVGALVTMVALVALIGVMYEFTGASDHKIVSPFIVLLASVAFYGAFYVVSRGQEGAGTQYFRDPRKVAVALVLAIIVRGITTTVINYYFTFPVFFDIPTAAALEWVPWYVMFALNAIQGVVDVAVAWLLVFRTKTFSYVQKAFIPS